MLDFIGESMTTVYHASATCKMGVLANDEMAVVDSQARVCGVQGVRVVDASAFPFLVLGHPQSTVYALAEKIADGIFEGNVWDCGGGQVGVEEMGWGAVDEKRLLGKREVLRGASCKEEYYGIIREEIPDSETLQKRATREL